MLCRWKNPLTLSHTRNRMQTLEIKMMINSKSWVFASCCVCEIEVSNPS
jgi:hypothetical protein